MFCFFKKKTAVEISPGIDGTGQLLWNMDNMKLSDTMNKGTKIFVHHTRSSMLWQSDDHFDKYLYFIITNL